jgi:hypothetical protein
MGQLYALRRRAALHSRLRKKKMKSWTLHSYKQGQT